MDPAALLALAAGLAGRAAAVILAVRAAGFVVERKSDRSAVTAADRLAEVLIVEALREATPDLPVIAEEEVAAGLMTALAGRYWLVDPLDGTNEFAAGRDGFAVCIGLIEAGRPILGAVALPATREVFWGGRGLGAWKSVGDAAPQPIAVRAPPAEGLTIMSGRHRPEEASLATFLAGRPVARVIRVGSAEKFCRVAEGTADLYPRFVAMREWDIAGPQAIVEAAGGSVRRLSDDRPLTFGAPDFATPPFLCRGRS